MSLSKREDLFFRASASVADLGSGLDPDSMGSLDLDPDSMGFLDLDPDPGRQKLHTKKFIIFIV